MTDVRALADEYWKLRHSNDHLEALWSGDITHLDEWDDLSSDGIASYQARLREIASRAATATGASVEERATLRTIEQTALYTAAQRQWMPQLQATNPEVGLLVYLFGFLPRMPLVTREDGARYVTKLRRIPDLIAQLQGSLVEGASSGVTPIRVHVSSMIRRLDGYLSSPVEADPILGQAAPTEGYERWSEVLGDAVGGVIRPAIAGLRDTLASTTLPAARDDDRPGLLYLEGGPEAYDERVRGNTSDAYTAESVHRIGLEQVARLADEYTSLAGPILGTTDLSEIFSRLRSDPDLHYRDQETLVADSEAALARATEAAKDWFGRLPVAACEVEATTVGALAYYSSPSGQRPGRFFFNAANPSRWGTFQIEATTFHEGVPGHHLQLALALELEGLADMHQQLYLSAFNEGWGLYTERLADEMGLYSSDLDRVGMLSGDSMRATRLVVDTGLHAFGWTREQAITYMVEHSPNSRDQCEGEIDRYIADPGQALGYMVGRLEIDAMRADAEVRLGDRFDVKTFHDLCLSQGTVTLDALREKVEAW